jgi:uncharacterized protein YbbK (DUF523 family)
MDKPTVVFSSCLLGENVRYDGKNINCPLALNISKYVNVIPVCPEVSIGLSVPRDPIIVVKNGNLLKVVNPKTGEDLTYKLEAFSKEFLSSLGDVDGFFLKAKSPSCGVSGTKTYKNEDGTGFLYRGKGIFGKIVKKYYPYLPVEDENTLKDKDRYFHFVLRIFLFSKIKRIKTLEDLYSFHKRYRYIFLLYSRASFERSENLLKTENGQNKIAIYREHIFKTVSRKPSLKRIGKNILLSEKKGEYKSVADIYRNVFLHMYPSLDGLIPEGILVNS